MVLNKKNKKEKFIQEYLYIDDEIFIPNEKIPLEKNKSESERGVFVISLF